MAETQPQLQPAALSLSAMISQCFTRKFIAKFSAAEFYRVNSNGVTEFHYPIGGRLNQPFVALAAKLVPATVRWLTKIQTRNPGRPGYNRSLITSHRSLGIRASAPEWDAASASA
jgi:hypothetical protein